ncbi:hypothetical protein C8Q76DRAFT_691116 [Earliella scabrosa]|nr:hypothetical protein C8Q76DRAFT_691116 [Earliella scabrosa]
MTSTLVNGPPDKVIRFAHEDQSNEHGFPAWTPLQEDNEARDVQDCNTLYHYFQSADSPTPMLWPVVQFTVIKGLQRVLVKPLMFESKDAGGNILAMRVQVSLILGLAHHHPQGAGENHTRRFVHATRMRKLNAICKKDTETDENSLHGEQTEHCGSLVFACARGDGKLEDVQIAADTTNALRRGCMDTNDKGKKHARSAYLHRECHPSMSVEQDAQDGNNGGAMPLSPGRIGHCVGNCATVTLCDTYLELYMEGAHVTDICSVYHYPQSGTVLAEARHYRALSTGLEMQVLVKGKLGWSVSPGCEVTPMLKR